MLLETKNKFIANPQNILWMSEVNILITFLKTDISKLFRVKYFYLYLSSKNVI